MVRFLLVSSISTFLFLSLGCTDAVPNVSLLRSLPASSNSVLAVNQSMGSQISTTDDVYAGEFTVHSGTQLNNLESTDNQITIENIKIKR